MKSYFTFGQAHVHPKTKIALKDYWIEVEAPTRNRARELIHKIFGSKWSMQYSEQEFNKEYFTKGCLMKLNIADEKSNDAVIEEMKEVPEKEECEDNHCRGHNISETISYFEKLREEKGDLRCDAIEILPGVITIFIDKIDILKNGSSIPLPHREFVKLS